MLSNPQRIHPIICSESLRNPPSHITNLLGNTPLLGPSVTPIPCVFSLVTLMDKFVKVNCIFGVDLHLSIACLWSNNL